MPLARFLNYGVDGEIMWPAEKAIFPFGKYEITAFPLTRDHDASLHIDLNRYCIADIAGASVLSEILSVAAWLDDAHAVLLDGWSGNPVPVSPGPPRHGTSVFMGGLKTWPNYWGPIESDVARRALALYREALNMMHFHSPAYAVLGFYKIVETTFDGPQRKSFLEASISRMLGSGELKSTNLESIGFSQFSSPEEIAQFLYRDGRHAVAHAKKEPHINPDDIDQTRGMWIAARILRKVARRYIIDILKVGTSRWQQE